ncbi:MAG: IS1595 family transposase [Anaerolineales bacterium]|nr:IS1595 family transposase [Anaerolineales bacterium]
MSGEVEADEVYVVAGHKGHPEIVQKLGRQGRRRRLQGARGRGTLAKEKPPIPGLFQRNGDVVLQMLPNVQQATIQPIITRTVTPGSRLYTDEYSSYQRLAEWGYEHKTVNHAQGEYARDEDGDGFHEDDGWERPAAAVDDQAQFMVTCMETWMMADRTALQGFFGSALNEGALLPLNDLERRQRDEVQEALERATGQQYRKGKRSFRILASLNPATLRQHLSYFSQQLIETLHAYLNE